MKEIWLYSAIAAAFATVPTHLKGQVEKLDGGGNYSTEIIPVVVGEKQCAVIGFCDITGSSPDEPRYLSAPFATVSILYPTKTTVWKDTKAADFGLTLVAAPNSPIKTIGLVEREGVTVKDFLDARSRYPKLISRVIESHWLITRHSVTTEEQTTARELQHCAHVLYDKPLLPYYHHIGRQFFAWMERAAK